MAQRRVGSPVGVALVAAVLAGLVTALVLSFLLEDEDVPAGEDAVRLTLPGDEAPPNTAGLGEPAPGFAYESLADGEEVDFESLRDGRPALINFFRRTCVPCVTEMPDLEEAFQQYGAEVAFLGLSYNESAEDGRALVERTAVTYETGRDIHGTILERFAGIGLPTTVFVAADGTIAAVHTGKLEPSEIEDELEALV